MLPLRWMCSAGIRLIIVAAFMVGRNEARLFRHHGVALLL
jgi:hypothetical protein